MAAISIMMEALGEILVLLLQGGVEENSELGRLPMVVVAAAMVIGMLAVIT